MPAGITAAVPVPSDLIDGWVPGYQRTVAYRNSSTGAIEGMRREEVWYNATGAATVAGQVVQSAEDGDEETGGMHAFIALAAGAAQRVGVTAGVIAATSFGWVTVQGYVDALVEGTTDVAKDDFLKTVTATSTTAFIKDGTARTAKSSAIACAAQAANSAVLTKVELLGADVVDVD